MLLAGTRAAGQAETMPAIRARAGALAGALLAAYTLLMSRLVRSLFVCIQCSAVAQACMVTALPAWMLGSSSVRIGSIDLKTY
jgi:N-acetylglucosamine-6-phosphate deacetylase